MIFQPNRKKEEESSDSSFNPSLVRSETKSPFLVEYFLVEPLLHVVLCIEEVETTELVLELRYRVLKENRGELGDNGDPMLWKSDDEYDRFVVLMYMGRLLERQELGRGKLLKLLGVFARVGETFALLASSS